MLITSRVHETLSPCSSNGFVRAESYSKDLAKSQLFSANNKITANPVTKHRLSKSQLSSVYTFLNNRSNVLKFNQEFSKYCVQNENVSGKIQNQLERTIQLHHKVVQEISSSSSESSPKCSESEKKLSIEVPEYFYFGPVSQFPCHSSTLSLYDSKQDLFKNALKTREVFLLSPEEKEFYQKKNEVVLNNSNSNDEIKVTARDYEMNPILPESFCFGPISSDNESSQKEIIKESDSNSSTLTVILEESSSCITNCETSSNTEKLSNEEPKQDSNYENASTCILDSNPELSEDDFDIEPPSTSKLIRPSASLTFSEQAEPKRKPQKVDSRLKSYRFSEEMPHNFEFNPASKPDLANRKFIRASRVKKDKVKKAKETESKTELPSLPFTPKAAENSLSRFSFNRLYANCVFALFSFLKFAERIDGSRVNFFLGIFNICCVIFLMLRFLLFL